MLNFKVVLLDTNFKILHTNLQIIILHPAEIPHGLEVLLPADLYVMEFH